MATTKQPMIITPKLLFGYAWVARPDEKGKHSDGKYKVTGKVAKDQLGEVTTWKVGPETVKGTYQEFLDMILDAHWENDGDEGEYKFYPVKDGDKPNKRNKPAPHPGYLYFTAKSQYQPPAVDAHKNKLASNVMVMSGDVGKLAIKINNKLDEGISLYLQSVQVLEKNAEMGDASNAFDDEEGYTSEPADEDDSDDDKGDDDETDF